MCADILLKAGQASLWAQPDGPNTKPQFLGCHEVGDITEPLGDITVIRRPDRAQTGKFKVVDSFQGAPGTPSTTITADVKATQDYLEKVTCKCSIFAHKVSCGRRDTFTNYDRSFVLANCTITSRGITGLAAAEQENDAPTRQTFDLGIEEVLRVVALTSGRQTIGATGDLRAINFGNAVQCAGACGVAKPECTYGVAVGNSPATSVTKPGEVWYTDDGGTNWKECAADPFDADEDIAAGACFPMGRSTMRILVARGTSDAGNPAEVAYSDDNGATWTTANVGAVNGQYVLDGEALFVLDQYNIWLGTQDGYIYKSEDGGLTWAVQETGVLAAAGINAIQFVSEDDGWAVGDNNAILKTEDGGTTWTAVTGPAGKASDECEALAAVTQYRVFVGYSDGELWYTENAGEDWSQRSIPVSASIINDIAFYGEYIGFLAYNTAAGSGGLLRTIDGGYTWEVVTGLPTNAGLSHLHVCGTNTAFAAGPVSGGTGVVLKAYAS